MNARGPISTIAGRIRTISFDCYGTLINWREGLVSSLGRLFGPAAVADEERLFAEYVAAEAQVEAATYRSYRHVLAETVLALAKRLNWDYSPHDGRKLAGFLPEWRPFADTNDALVRLKRRFRLGVLSNIDRDLFAETSRHFSIEFDFVITAEDVGAYKPATGHFERMLARFGPPGCILHAAQSLFHDGVPAGARGIPFVWVNRYQDRNETDVSPLAVIPDLKTLADALDDPQSIHCDS